MDRQNCTDVTCSAMWETGTPKAVAALKILAPSKCTGSPCWHLTRLSVHEVNNILGAVVTFCHRLPFRMAASQMWARPLVRQRQSPGSLPTASDCACTPVTALSRRSDCACFLCRRRPSWDSAHHLACRQRHATSLIQHAIQCRPYPMHGCVYRRADREQCLTAKLVIQQT